MLRLRNCLTVCKANAKLSGMQNTLDDWLAKEPLGRSKELAQFLGISESHLSQVRRGKRKVRTPWMEQIEKFTRGHVTIVQMVKDVSANERLERRNT